MLHQLCFVSRARFSEITLPSIERAINTLEAPNKLLSDAVSVRSELDLRIGKSPMSTSHATVFTLLQRNSLFQELRLQGFRPFACNRYSQILLETI